MVGAPGGVLVFMPKAHKFGPLGRGGLQNQRLGKCGREAMQERAPELKPGEQATEQGAASANMMTEVMRPKRTLKKD